jgi:hypothetical protein
MNHARRFVMVFAVSTILSVVVTTGTGVAGASGGSAGAKLSFNPVSVVVDGQYWVNGSGFRPNSWVTVGAYYADTTWWTSGRANDQGHIHLGPLTATSSGQILHVAKSLNEKTGRMRLLATATLTVPLAG